MDTTTGPIDTSERCHTPSPRSSPLTTLRQRLELALVGAVRVSAGAQRLQPRPVPPMR